MNLAALDELNTSRERKGFLDSQSEDLIQAIDTLEDAIREDHYEVLLRTETDGKVPAVGTATFQSSAHCALTASGWTSRNRS